MFVRVKICRSLNCGRFQLLKHQSRCDTQRGGASGTCLPGGGADSPVWTAVFSELPQRENKPVRVKSKTLNVIKYNRNVLVITHVFFYYSGI